MTLAVKHRDGAAADATLAWRQTRALSVNAR